MHKQIDETSKKSSTKQTQTNRQKTIQASGCSQKMTASAMILFLVKVRGSVLKNAAMLPRGPLELSQRLGHGIEWPCSATRETCMSRPRKTPLVKGSNGSNGHPEAAFPTN